MVAPDAEEDDDAGADGVDGPASVGGTVGLGLATGGEGLKESAGLAAGGLRLLSVLLLRFSIVA